MKLKLRPLDTQVVVITGATSGIGLVTARKAAAKRARLVLASRNEGALKFLADEINAAGGESVHVAADVGNEEDVRRIGATARQRFGGFDTWVNNAGVSIYGNLTHVSLADHRRLFETNYWGVVHGSLVAVEHLRQRGGALINIGSALSDRAIPVQGAYCASKHAVKGFTDALRMELEHERIPISVTLIKPAAIDTPYKDHAKNYLPVAPQNPPPVYAPEVVAEAILYCAENPQRDVFVGAGGKGISLAGHYAPEITDKVMEWTMFDLQESDKPAGNPQHNALYQPSGPYAERGGYEGHVAESSLYTNASLHPLIAGGLLLAGAGLAYVAFRESASRGRGNGHYDTNQPPAQRTI
ncbi:MAG: SDR family oxidoreductase [Pyrinomonadaceae bacterium]|nr:SDR family oxidoreductase [Pyrinomonadaceae bacterium]